MHISGPDTPIPAGFTAPTTRLHETLVQGNNATRGGGGLWVKGIIKVFVSKTHIVDNRCVCTYTWFSLLVLVILWCQHVLQQQILQAGASVTTVSVINSGNSV